VASIFDFSSTEASNVTIGGYNTNTGMTPANVDNVFRALASIIRQTFTSALQSFFAGTAALPLANGGTNATDAATARANLGALADTYRDIPYRSVSASTSIVATDRASGIEYTGSGGHTITLDPNATTPIGSSGQIAAIMVLNRGSGSVTLTRGSGVDLRKNGATSSADAVLAAGGVATLLKLANFDVWLVSGSGIS